MLKQVLLAAGALVLLGSCVQDGDTIYNEVPAPTLKIDGMRSDLITMTPEGNDLTFSWPMIDEGMSLKVDVISDGNVVSSEIYPRDVTSFVHHNLVSNVKYVYLFRVTDGTDVSDGVTKTYTRAGATAVTELTVSQREGENGYEAVLTWAPLSDATEVEVTVSKNGTESKATVEGTATEHVVKGLAENDELSFSVITRNEQGASLPETTSIKIGKTAVAFLSYYATPEELINNGDDDEAAAWMWFHNEYPTSRFLYAGNITGASDLNDLRVIFYIRDVQEGNENDVWQQPAAVESATPAITEWYKNGGNLLLWQHATTYIGDLGRVSKDLLRNNDRRITLGRGSWNDYRWHMAVHANLGGRYYIDYSKHPIYSGLTVNPDGTITVKGTCWTEDHNCCFFNIPERLTGMNNQSADTYETLTKVYGIYPLATWDNEQMNFVSMLNVWEAQQGNTDYRGTVLCIGNGGLEFSYNNSDGSRDVCARPMNNPYHGSVLRIAHNAIEYLKTR